MERERSKKRIKNCEKRSAVHADGESAGENLACIGIWPQEPLYHGVRSSSTRPKGLGIGANWLEFILKYNPPSSEANDLRVLIFSYACFF